MMTILLTGAGGYIGSRFIELFHDKYDIIGVDNLYYNQGHLVYDTLRKIDFYQYDVNDEDHQEDIAELVSSADIVIPLAALVGAGICDQQPITAQDTNLHAIKRILAMCHNKQLVIYPNSNSSYGQIEGLCTEESPRNALSFYAAIKDEAEISVREYPNNICLRLATIFGVSPRMRLDLLVNDIVYKAYFDETLTLFDPDFYRNYLHVDDICGAIDFAIENQVHMVGEVYNVGNDSLNCTKRDLLKQVQEKVICEILSSDETDRDKRNYKFSSAKLMSVGWKPNCSLSYGISQLLQYYSYLPFITGERAGVTRPMRNIDN